MADVARRLGAAAATSTPIPPVREELGAADLDRAYAVQQLLIGERLAGGGRLIGRKIGLTNPKVQAQLGVDQPDFGVLLDDMACRDGSSVDTGRLLQPRIEAEVAFLLAADLDGTEPIDLAAIRAAVGYATAALEIVDSRIAGWDIGIVDTIADNASCGLFVLGTDQLSLNDLSPVEVGMTMRRNGDVVSTGSGAECLGDPLLALGWLAKKVRELGQPLRAGEIVLSGALGPMVDVRAGDDFVADLAGLGRVSVTFTPPTTSLPLDPREPS